MAIAALVLGIVAVVFAFTPLVFLSPFIAIVGIVLAVLARKSEKSGASTAGLILSIIGLVLGGIMWIACSLCAAGMKEGIKELQKDPGFKSLQQEMNKAIDDATKKAQDINK